MQITISINLISCYQPILLRQLVPLLSASHLHLLEHTWNPHQAQSWPLLESSRFFLHKIKRMRNECFKNQPMFIFKKSILRKISWKTCGIFLGGKYTQNGEEGKALTRLLLSSLLEMGKHLILNGNEALNPRAEN